MTAPEGPINAIEDNAINATADTLQGSENPVKTPLNAVMASKTL